MSQNLAETGHNRVGPTRGLPCPLSPTGQCDHGDGTQLCGDPKDHCSRALASLYAFAKISLLFADEVSFQGNGKQLKMLTIQNGQTIAFVQAGVKHSTTEYRRITTSNMH